MKIKIKNKIIEIKECNSFFSKICGLMFCGRENARALLFEFNKPTKMRIHSMFVFFDFIAIWLDSDGKVVDLKVIKPWKFSVRSKEKFVRLIEIPINRRYSELVSSLKEDKKSLKTNVI